MAVGFISIGNLAPSSIWMFPAVGGAPVKLASDNHLNTSPEWLGPSRVVFVSDRDDSRDLFVVAVSKTGAPMGEPRRLTTGYFCRVSFAWRKRITAASVSLSSALVASSRIRRSARL